jgi:hypothetical protein
VSIEELQMETQSPAAKETPQADGASKPKKELRSELDLLRDREYRLKAD